MPDMTPGVRQWEIEHDDIPDLFIQPNLLDSLYVTKLSPLEEILFREFWSKYHRLFPNRIPANPDEPGQYYDFRGWWKKYVVKNPNFFEEIKRNPGAHQTDEFKLPGHPTYSTQSRYYYPGQEEITPVGVWRKNGKFQELNPFI